MQNLSSPPAANAEVQINENFETLGHQETYGKRHPATSGLVWGYYGGRWGGFTVADGTFTLIASTINYLVVRRSTGVISQATTLTNWDNLLEFARVARLTTGVSTVTTAEDHRAGPGGTHGQSVFGQPSPFQSDTATSRAFTRADAGRYTRFTNAAAKAGTFSSAASFLVNDEFHIANRAVSGDLTLSGSGITLNVPKNGTLVLAPGDTVTVKFYDSTNADVIGSTKAA